MTTVPDPEPEGDATGPEPAGDPEVAPVRPIDRFARGAAGSVLAAGLLGVANALEGRPERDRPVITAEAPAGRPPDRFELHLDPDHPERSFVVVHPPAASAGE